MSKTRYTIVTLAAMIILCPSHVHAQGPDTLWTRRFGGTIMDQAHSVQQTFDGGYIVAGQKWRHMLDWYVIKTDANGDTAWTRYYGGNGLEICSSVRQTPDSGYILTGYTGSVGAGKSDVYLMKLDPDGEIVWEKTYGGSENDQGFSMVCTPDNGYVITGRTESFGVGDQDVYLLKTDENGDTLWTRTYGGGAADCGESVAQTTDGGYVIAGSTDSFGMGNGDAYLIRTDENGDTLWTRTYGGVGEDAAHSVEVVADGGYIIAGTSWSFATGGFYVVRTDASGDTLWHRIYDGGDAWEVSPTSDNGYIVVGDVWSPPDNDNWDVYLVKTNHNGDTLWTRKYGGADTDCGYAVQQTSDEGYIVAGGYIYVIKTGPDPYAGLRNKYRSTTCFVSLRISPNPSLGTIMVGYHLPVPSPARVVVYNVLGREVRSLVGCDFGIANGQMAWDGRDWEGQEVPAGIYFIRLQAGDKVATQKVVLIR